MDVIALTEAGFGEAVAPLGTALTEEQVKLLWRMSEEPILCFDGDAAGRKAAFRAVETALPLLKPGFSVRFAFLPGGLDPDDLVRQQGPQAFAEELGKTRALFDVLWEREAQEQDLSTPEQRAAFEARLKAMVAKIGDAAVRSHYESELRETLWALNRTVVREIARGQGPRQGAGGSARRNNIAPDWRIRERARLGPTAQAAPPAPPERQPRAGGPDGTRPSPRGTAYQNAAQSPLAARRARRGDCGDGLGLRPPRPPARRHACGAKLWIIILTAPVYAPN